MAPLTSSPDFDNATESERLLDTRSADSNIEPRASINGQDREAIAFKLAAAAYSFVVAGLFVATIGVTLPHQQTYYQLNDIQVSAIFLVGPVGYCFASLLNSRIHEKLGQRGIAFIGPACHLVYAVVGSFHPPFPVFLLGVTVGSFGVGIVDGSWCAWVAALKNANTLSGLLHGSFSIGAATCPYLAGIMLSANNGQWYQWFYVLAIASAAEVVFLPLAFRHETAAKYHENKKKQGNPEDGVDQRAIFRYSATWIYAAYLLAYVGTECTVSGWVVTFMLRVRHTSTYASSICSSGFWAGMAVGRLALGAVTEKLTPKRAVIIYLALAPAIVVLFMIVQVLWVSVLSMALLGFVMGPLFPSCIVEFVHYLPKELHVGAVSFVASLGQVGGAILPYMLGAITQVAGLHVFPYMLLSQFAVILLLWLISFKAAGKKILQEEPVRIRQD
ncbi:MFS transporter [Colletotrichum simmondsii]|uniref:MFS transporter n=1 Tax=Colletotrichum simmondsii TaxID=703756 RepID=A0A135SQ70_9PEZI|nr:MFS transporter [Colletotrichum simmondsii]